MVRLLSYSLPALWLAAFPFRGKLRPGGFRKLFASITTKVRGTRTPGTLTTVDSSFSYPPGGVSEGLHALILSIHGSNSSALGSFTIVTDTRGGSGGRLDSAGSDE